MNLTIFVPEKHRKEVEASKKRLNLSKLFLTAFLEWKSGAKYQNSTKDACKLRTAIKRIRKIASTVEKQCGKEETKEE
jgi:hypothetical protein